MFETFRCGTLRKIAQVMGHSGFRHVSLQNLSLEKRSRALRLVPPPSAGSIHDKGTTMNCFKRLFALALLGVTSLLQPASAQVPRDAPRGSICVTPMFWCRAVRPGPPRGECACPTKQGWVKGVLN